jgi:murein DD-endopeptidase MepM/ murein hydrolase activator NlpD
MFLYDSYAVAANGTHDYIRELLEGDTTPLADGVFGNPFPGMDWSGNITSTFGHRPYPGVGVGTDNHTGLDIGLPEGTSIHAVNSGTVLFVRDSGSAGYGKHLAIHHGGGYVTLYAHCSSISVTAGQTVSKGDEIAKLGSTGWSTNPHLHIEVIIDGTPVDPLGYISNG